MSALGHNRTSGGDLGYVHFTPERPRDVRGDHVQHCDAKRGRALRGLASCGAHTRIDDRSICAFGLCALDSASADATSNELIVFMGISVASCWWSNR